MHQLTSEEAATKGCEFWRSTCDRRPPFGISCNVWRSTGTSSWSILQARACHNGRISTSWRRDHRLWRRDQPRRVFFLQVLLVLQKISIFGRTVFERNQVHHLRETCAVGKTRPRSLSLAIPRGSTAIGVSLDQSTHTLQGETLRRVTCPRRRASSWPPRAPTPSRSSPAWR